ncbi:hypothetical protein D7Y27_31475 [Corallococcus sp. AB004]|nr:hypothetical protein D7V77_35260 [Corallococcus sp. CA041A]RKI00193.1 hypothetical protein D7Y04_17350 [Corallococcus sp. AB038B]RKI09621.1 hypothetical protein D7Y15_23535 [Corallococcus sp. AB030]RKI35503.1 hypothetical protein D7Y27_31475 [Corallococcus sp. AB004]RUO87962.1 hypothetical protein D7Y11_37925 [Corallococcus sp. AB018]
MITSSFMRSSLVAALLLSGSAFAGESKYASAAAAACTELKSELSRSAKEQGLAIDEAEIGTHTSEQATVVATSIAGFDKVPATEYAKGVDAAFVYIDSEEAGIPAGNYRVSIRANPEDIKVGKYKAIASLIDKDGKEVAQRATVIETFPSAVKSARYGSPMSVGIQQHTINDWNLTRFRKTIIVVIVHSWGVTVIDLFGTDYSSYYGF